MICATLLERFIRSEIESYVEPPRKGIKGNPPGRFSAQKHKAVLLMLRAGTQKAIAAEVGVSQALLLKWRTETEFRGMTISYLRKFIILFMETLREISSKYSPETLPSNALADFSDVLDYSEILKVSILDCALWVDRKDLIKNGWPIFVIFQDILFASSGQIGAVEAGALTLRLVWLKVLSEKLNQAQSQGYPGGLVRMFVDGFLRDQERSYDRGWVNPNNSYRHHMRSRRAWEKRNDALFKKIEEQAARGEEIFATTMTKTELASYLKTARLFSALSSVASTVVRDLGFQSQLNDLMMDR